MTDQQQRQLAKNITHAALYGRSGPTDVLVNRNGDIVTTFAERMAWIAFRDEYVSTLRGVQTWLSAVEAERAAELTWKLMTGADPVTADDHVTIRRMRNGGL